MTHAIAELNQFSADALRLGVVLTAEQLDWLGLYCLKLQEYDAHTNLVGNSDTAVVLKDHVLDSLSLLTLLEANPKGSKLIDIGTGAGFPGIILAIANPRLNVSLVDSVGKKTRFLEEVIAHLKLEERVEVLNVRAEELCHYDDFRAQYDYATCRAVGNTALALELMTPFLKKGGFALLQKTRDQSLADEVLAAKNARRVGASLSKTVMLDAAILGKERAVMVFTQNGLCPPMYARPAAQFKKEPLF